jgi:alpha-1,6-mannosyltransferase
MHLLAGWLGLTDQRVPDGLVVAGVGLVALSVIMLRLLIADDTESVVIAALAHGCLYLTAVWLVVRRASGRRTLVFVMSVALLTRVIALTSPPTLSGDAFRYIWDGRVQAAGINPYRYVPADERLVPLRDTAIYPNVDKKEYAHTIYPPVAQVIFLGVSRISETVTAMKLAMLGFDLFTIWIILTLLQTESLAPARVLIYAWHPLPIWEFAGNGHVDAAAIAFMCLAMLAAGRGRRAMAGVALGVATLVKFFPLAIIPTLWRPWDWRLPTAFAVSVAAAYLPYLGVGLHVFGFLPGYGSEEGYRDGSGFFVVELLRALGVPSPSGPIFMVLAVGIFAVVAVAIAFHPPSEEEAGAGQIVLGVMFLLLVSPHYPWYCAWVLPFLCRMVYVPLLYLTLACFVLYIPELEALGYEAHLLRWLYLGFVVLIGLDLLGRYWPLRRLT